MQREVLDPTVPVSTCWARWAFVIGWAMIALPLARAIIDRHARASVGDRLIGWLNEQARHCAMPNLPDCRK